MKRIVSATLSVLLAVTLLGSLGCGDKSKEEQAKTEPPGKKSRIPDAPQKPKTFAVSGKVTFAGAPLSGATVQFVPESGDRIATDLSEEGAFELKDGAPAGRYKVIIQVDSPPPAESPVLMKYTRPETTPITVEVVENSDENQFTIELRP